MRRWWAIVPVIALAAGLIVGPAGPAAPLTLTPTDPDRQCGWPIAYPGSANYAFPDTSAAYFVQAAILGPGEEIIFAGKDPKARYWSMQTYRFSDSTLIDSVNDVTVKRLGKRGAKAKRWTITVTSPDRDNGRNPNVLSGAGEFDGVNFGSNITVVMFRVYVSKTKTASGGPMPKVTLKSRDASGKTVTTRLKTCTKDQVGLPENRPNLTAEEGLGLEFLRGPAARFYPSADTSYLVAQAPHREDEILVMTGRAPRTPKDMRYWSVCQNVNAGDLPVVDCLRDEQVTLDAERRYAIAIVTTEQRARVSPKDYPGVSFLDWGDPTDGSYADAFLVYRNILPNKRFAGSASRVPVLEPAQPVIGDFAPQFAYLTVEEFASVYGTAR